MSTETLLEKFRVIAADMSEAARNMGETQRQMTVGVFEDLVDSVFPKDDIETDEDMMRLAAARTAVRFSSRMLDAMLGHTAEEILEAMKRLDEVQS